RSSLGSSSACTARNSSRGRASAWRTCAGSSTAMAAAPGPKEPSRRAPLFISRYRTWEGMVMVAEVKRILLVEDSPNDVELTLAALAENHLANEVVVARDGEEALDYLYQRGMFRLREPGNPAVVL